MEQRTGNSSKITQMAITIAKNAIMGIYSPEKAMLARAKKTGIPTTMKMTLKASESDLWVLGDI